MTLNNDWRTAGLNLTDKDKEFLRKKAAEMAARSTSTATAYKPSVTDWRTPATTTPAVTKPTSSNNWLSNIGHTLLGGTPLDKAQNKPPVGARILGSEPAKNLMDVASASSTAVGAATQMPWRLNSPQYKQALFNQKAYKDAEKELLAELDRLEASGMSRQDAGRQVQSSPLFSKYQKAKQATEESEGRLGALAKQYQEGTPVGLQMLTEAPFALSQPSIFASGGGLIDDTVLRLGEAAEKGIRKTGTALSSEAAQRGSFKFGEKEAEQAAETVAETAANVPVRPNVVPSSNQRPFSGVTISDTDELLNRIKSQRLQGAAAKITDVRGINTAAKIVNPIAASSDVGTTLRAMTGMIDDQISGGTTLLMSRPTQLERRGLNLFKTDMKGITHAVDIKQIKPLPNGQHSLALHDIVEYAPWYDLGTGKTGQARKSFIDSVRNTSDEISNMLRNEGILVDAAPQPGQIQALKGEDGWSFLHRVVTQVKEEAADSLAIKISTAIRKDGFTFPRQAGESNYQYVARFADEVAAGTIQPTEGINKLLDDFANLADVNVKKTTVEAKRKWTTVADGMKSGQTYEANPVVELNKQIRASYDLVKRKRLGEAITSLLETTTPTEKAASELGVNPEQLIKAKSQSDKLVEYVQRAARGESLPGASIQTIRQNFPDIATELDQALAILPRQRSALIDQAMRAATDAARMTKGDAEAIARRAEILANIKLAFKELDTKPSITRSDIVEVIDQTIADKAMASRAVKALYSDLNTTQKNALKTILDKAKTKGILASDDLRKLEDLTAKYSERMGSLGTTEYGRVPGIPGLGNRVIVPQGGKMGQEIADELRHSFGYLPKSGADKAIEAAGQLGAMMRMGRLGFDMSATFIQQALSLGYDLKNLISLHPTAVWAKSTGGAIRSVTSRDMVHLESFLNKNSEMVRDFIQRGGLVETAETTEGIRAFESLATKVPEGKARSAIDSLIRQTLGRSDAVFTTGRVEAAVNMFKAGYKGAERAGKLDEWARMVNELTGVLSTRAMGISQSQRAIESALGFMSPRFTRASAGIFFDILRNPASYTSKQAAESLGALLAAGTAAYVTIQSVQDKPVTLNPFDPDFGNVEIGNRTYRLGGIISDARRLMAAIDSATYAASGQHISLSGKEDQTPTLDKLGFQQFQSKTSPITGTGIDLIRMLSNKGDTYSFGKKLSWSSLLGNWISPSWSDPLLNKEQDALAGTAAEFTGITSNEVNRTPDPYTAPNPQSEQIIKQSLKDINVKVTNPEGKLHGLKLDDNQTIELQQRTSSLVGNGLSKLMNDRYYQSLGNAEKKEAIQYIVNKAKEEARNQYIIQSDVTQPQNGDNKAASLARKDLGRVRQYLEAVSQVKTDKARILVGNILRSSDPGLDVALILNGYANEPKTDQAETLLSRRKNGSAEELPSSSNLAISNDAIKMIDLYYQIDDFVWNQYRPEVKKFAEQTMKLEDGTAEQHRQAAYLIRTSPYGMLSLRARTLIYQYKAMARGRNRILDYYLKTYA